MEDAQQCFAFGRPAVWGSLLTRDAMPRLTLSVCCTSTTCSPAVQGPLAHHHQAARRDAALPRRRDGLAHGGQYRGAPSKHACLPALTAAAAARCRARRPAPSAARSNNIPLVFPPSFLLPLLQQTPQFNMDLRIACSNNPSLFCALLSPSLNTPCRRPSSTWTYGSPTRQTSWLCPASPWPCSRVRASPGPAAAAPCCRRWRLRRPGVSALA